MPTDQELQALSTEHEVTELGELWAGMTPRMRLYVQSRLEGLTPQQSYKAAGVVGSDTARFEQHPKIIRYLSLSTRSAVRKTLISRNDVIDGLLDAVESAGSSMELTQAWREIGRIIGAYEPAKVDVSLKIESLRNEQLVEMSEGELLEMTTKYGRYEIDTDEDPDSEIYANFREALAEPEPRRDEAPVEVLRGVREGVSDPDGLDESGASVPGLSEASGSHEEGGARDAGQGAAG